MCFLAADTAPAEPAPSNGTCLDPSFSFPKSVDPPLPSLALYSEFPMCLQPPSGFSCAQASVKDAGGG